MRSRSIVDFPPAQVEWLDGDSAKKGRWSVRARFASFLAQVVHEQQSSEVSKVVEDCRDVSIRGRIITKLK